LRGFVITISLFLFSLPSFSQAVKGCFFADTTGSGAAAGYSMCKKGCLPLKVIVNDTCSNVYKATNPKNPPVIYVWGDGGTFVEADTHTYFKPGIYTVQQIITPNNGSTTYDTLYNYFEALANPPPVFKVSVCVNKLVHVTIEDSTYNTYTVNFGDGTTLPGAKDSTVSYTYLDTTGKTITVTGFYNNSCGCHGSASKTITPLNHLVTPDVTTLTVPSQSATGQVDLNYNVFAYLNYVVEFKTGLNGTYSPVDYVPDTGQGTANLTFFSKLNTLNNQYCIRVATYDQCGDSLSSPPLCSTIITAAAQNNQNTIMWSNDVTGTFKDYIITRNGAVLTTITNPATTSYIDTSVQCGEKYCYQLTYQMQTTDQAGANISSISAPACTTAISTTTPPTITGLTATVINNKITLNWMAGSGVKVYSVYKTVNGKSSGSDTATTNSFTDPSGIVPEDQYCYTISYTDSCGNTSPLSNTVCPSILSIIDSNGTITLSWTPYVGSGGTTPTYTINLLDNNGNVIASYPVGGNQNFTIPAADSTDKTLNYQIVVSYGTSSVYSNIYTLERTLKLYVPNAFTPNGDGNNDVFIPKAIYMKDLQMTIFNRWGEIVFFTNSYTGWDGTFKGAPATIDSYAYAITATDIWGGETTKRGTVTLLK